MMPTYSKKQVDVTKLEVKEYKSWSEITDALGWERSKGAIQISFDKKRVERYCKMERVQATDKHGNLLFKEDGSPRYTQRIRIVEIYDEPRTDK